MERLGIIGGSAFLEEAAPEGSEARTVNTARGEVRVHIGERVAFLQRHGHRAYRPPHRIPHHAHALALESLGISSTVGLCSVGSLHRRIEPGCVVVPDDYLSVHPPPTFAADRRLHIVPALDESLRRLLLRIAGRLDAPVRDGGVYAQTRGPRFETRAEIAMLSDYAEVVGMTGASEATLLQERGIAYALLGIVDNYAHGIGDEPLTREGFEDRQERNRGRARAVLRMLRQGSEPWGDQRGETG